MSFLNQVHISFITLILVVASWSCADSNILEDDQSTYKILNGERTNSFPAIGELELKLSNDRRGLCTGTLVSPSVVLTAAHCISYETGKKDFGKFVVKNSKKFDINGGITFSSKRHLGPHDLALLHLKESVARNLARPLNISQNLPEDETAVEMFGFGCEDREDLEGSGKKQAFGFAYGDVTRNLCPGDSGGPVVIPETKEIILINSAYKIEAGDDIFAIPSYLFSTLSDAIETLEDKGRDGVLDFKDIGETVSKKPTRFRLELQPERVVRLSWQAKGEYHLYFEFQRRKQRGSGEWREPVDIGFGRRNYTAIVDRTVEKKGTYQYRVRSLNSAGRSSWTGWKTIEVD